MTPPTRIPGLVSIVIPCRNEAAHIASCLDSVLAGDFPHDRLEVLVVDGASEDGTRGIVEDYAHRHPVVRLVDNPKRVTPAGLNAGIAASRGDVIVRMDAHTTYDRHYVSGCVAALQTTGADNVGGIWVIAPKADTWFAEALAIVLAHPFGIGGGRYRLRPTAPMEVDTVPFGCYRREVFDRLGGFDERLARGQDMDFNNRLRAAGGRIVLVPDVVSHYHPRTGIAAFARHMVWSAVWLFYPLRFGRVAFRARHLVPGAFVGVLAASAVAGLFWTPARWVLAGTAGAYLAVMLGASLGTAARRRRVRLALTLPFAFTLLHIAYGAGTLLGLARVLHRPGLWHYLTGRLR